MQILGPSSCDITFICPWWDTELRISRESHAGCQGLQNSWAVSRNQDAFLETFLKHFLCPKPCSVSWGYRDESDTALCPRSPRVTREVSVCVCVSVCVYPLICIPHPRVSLPLSQMHSVIVPRVWEGGCHLERGTPQSTEDKRM